MSAADPLVGLEHGRLGAPRRDGRVVLLDRGLELVRHVAPVGRLGDVEEAVPSLLDVVGDRDDDRGSRSDS